jgi:hypothetical protein
MYGNTLGDFSSIGDAYAGAAAQRQHTLATGESMVIMPAVGALANYAVIEVVQTNNGRFGSFLSRGTGQVTELQDLNNVFEPTDTGTEAAVFYDATSGNILLKNKNAASRTFTVSVRNIGSI